MEENIGFGQRMKNCCTIHWQGLMVLLLPLICLPLLFMEPRLEFNCLYVLILMALFWVTEALPLGVTAFLPIVLFPMMEILDSDRTCLAYFKDALILFFAGLAVAVTIEYCNLHKRVALMIILLVGCSPRRLHFSLMFVSMFLSLWISNAAATAMMCPIIKGVLQELEAQGMIRLNSDKPPLENEPPYPSKISVCFYLGVAYASSAGGIGTLIGTGTNIIFKGLYDEMFPEYNNDVDFGKFAAYTLPSTLVITILMCIALQFLLMGLFRPNSQGAKELNFTNESAKIANDVVRVRKNELGPMSIHEVSVGLLFCLMIALFLAQDVLSKIFRENFDLRTPKQREKIKVGSSFPAILVVFFLFAMPLRYTFCKYFIGKRPEPEGTAPTLASWKIVNKEEPWGMLLLMGGGFALSEGLKYSGLAMLLGKKMSVLSNFPLPIIQFLVIFAGIFSTAFTANMAICNIWTPILLEMSCAIGVHPLYLTLPNCLGISMAFHLPVSTPANAIVAGYANIRTSTMAYVGILPTVIAQFTLFLFGQTWMYILYPQISEKEHCSHVGTTTMASVVTSAPAAGAP